MNGLIRGSICGGCWGKENICKGYDVIVYPAFLIIIGNISKGQILQKQENRIMCGIIMQSLVLSHLQAEPATQPALPLS